MSGNTSLHDKGSERTTFVSGFLLYFGLVGFAVAQTVYDLILSTPEFLIARQNTTADLWGLVIALSVMLPFVLAITGWLLGKISSAFEKIWASVVCLILSTLFFAQVLQSFLAASAIWFVIIATALGAVTTALLVFRLRFLGTVLGVLALSFPLLFLLRAPALGGAVYSAPLVETGSDFKKHSIVMVLADELPLATLMNSDGSIDAKNFPNISALQQTSTWYRQAITAADGTLEAVSAILTGRFPRPEGDAATIASLPYNLFTVLPDDYQFNVTESLTRLCPQSRCPVAETPSGQRLGALLLDMVALYLHRIVPDAVRLHLPNVSDNWSGFFAAKQEFFPGGWVEFAQGQAHANRPEMFRQFIRNIEESDQPRLDFIHILYPHVPFVYLPDGRNYGNHWLRGLSNEQWGDSPWGVLSGRQRSFLQVQHFDRLMGELLDHLRATGRFDDSIVVLVADHGAAFRVNHPRRVLNTVNAPEILRVPMMIKWPGQKEAEVRDDPVMTVDIVPTLLAAIGLSDHGMDADGMDLSAGLVPATRERIVMSYTDRVPRRFTIEELDIRPEVEINREGLQLDERTEAPWGIGPLQMYHSTRIESLCASQTEGIRTGPSAFNSLSPMGESEYVGAYISGVLDGEYLPQDDAPFVLESGGVIGASGETWVSNGTHHYFTMVHPEVLEQNSEPWRIWLVNEDECYGGKVAMP